jgi:hypothetical protein
MLFMVRAPRHPYMPTVTQLGRYFESLVLAGISVVRGDCDVYHCHIYVFPPFDKFHASIDNANFCHLNIAIFA